MGPGSAGCHGIALSPCAASFLSLKLLLMPSNMTPFCLHIACFVWCWARLSFLKKLKYTYCQNMELFPNNFVRGKNVYFACFEVEKRKKTRKKKVVFVQLNASCS